MRESQFLAAPATPSNTRVVGQEVTLTAERMLDMQSPVGGEGKADWETGREGQREKERGGQTEPECAASVCVCVCVWI